MLQSSAPIHTLYQAWLYPDAVTIFYSYL